MKTSWGLNNIERYYSRIVLIVLMGLMSGLVGCGGQVGSTPPTTQASPAINGNFGISAISQTTFGTNSFGGGLQTDASGHVTGVLHVTGALLPCFINAIDLAFAGSIDSNGRLSGTITSSTMAVTVNGQLSPDGSVLSSGTYSGNGTGCAAGDHGTITGFAVQPFTGTYSGTYTFSAGTTISLTIPLVQQTTPDSRGLFEFTSSTVTASGGSACGMDTATFDVTRSVAFGGEIGINLIGSDGVTRATLVGTTTTNSTIVLPGGLAFGTGPCSGQIGLGTLTRP